MSRFLLPRRRRCGTAAQTISYSHGSSPDVLKEHRTRYSKHLRGRYVVSSPQKLRPETFLQHPHHPWKGWQEHHRIHKAKIDNLIQRLEHGEDVSETDI